MGHPNAPASFKPGPHDQQAENIRRRPGDPA
jgi:hypothetical protein